ncbi:MAG: NUDIX domain-containing protein [Nanoarchaeota archaeon]|nr:NUDIX domain-containing protein [Nanoarchaeota archaeon]
MKSRVVASAVIIKGDYLLFCKKPKGLGPYPDKWLIVGGGVNLGDETAEEALKREIREEADIEVIDIEPVGFDEDFAKNKHGESVHYIFLNFRVNYLSGVPKPQDDIEILEWVHKDKVKELDLCKPSLRLFEKLGYI